jgi:hypothetical protein
MKCGSRFSFPTLKIFAIHASPGDNPRMKDGVKSDSPSAGRVTPATGAAPFVPGAVVIATLSNPREKFWGMILALAAEGLSLSGAELASFEDLAVMVRDGEPFTPAVVFFPMHRIERVELDLPDGSLPSLSQRFLAKTGLQPSSALAHSLDAQETALSSEQSSGSQAPKERR